MKPPDRLALACAAALLGAACTPPDPKEYIEVVDFETYWIVDSTAGDRVYLAPAARLELRNRSDQPCPALQAAAVFRLVDQEDAWGNDWQQITRAGEPLVPGQSVIVVLRSDARYHSNANPEAFFEHELFKDARVEIFLRVGSSGLVSFVEGIIERQVGSRTAVLAEP